MFNYIGNDLYVDVGTVTFAGNAFASNPNLRLTINTGATAIFNTTQKLAGLTINGTGKLDLKTSDLVLNYSSVSPVGIWTGSAYDGVTGQVQTGRIFSSSAVGNLKRLGVAEARDARGLSGSQTATWSGQTIDSTSVLVKFTWGGDANLDGQINIDDYGQIDFNVQSSGSVFGWFRGDFNLDGLINVDDYGVIDSAVSTQDGIL